MANTQCCRAITTSTGNVDRFGNISCQQLKSCNIGCQYKRTYEVSILDDQQGISITEEPVFILDSFFVGFHGQLITGERTGHDQQTCFW